MSATTPQQPVAIEDLYELSIPTDIQIAPDGSFLVWTQKWVDRELGKTFSHLVRADESGDGSWSVRPITPREPGSDSGARISPDGSWILFRRVPHDTDRDNSKPKMMSLCTMPAGGGDVRVFANRAGTFSSYDISPDGHHVVVSFRYADEIPKGASAPWSIRVWRMPYKLDGVGYMPADWYRLYFFDLRYDEPPMMLLSDSSVTFDDLSPVFSPDGKSVAFLSNRHERAHVDSDNVDIYVMAFEGGEARKITHKDGMVNAAGWSPDGAMLYSSMCPGPPCTGLFRKNVELFAVPADGSAEERSLTADYDYPIMNLTIDDLWGIEDWAPAPVLGARADAALVLASHKGNTFVGAVPIDGGDPIPVIDDATVVSLSARPGLDRIAFITTSPTQPGRVEVSDSRGQDRSLVHWALDDYCSSRSIAEPTRFEVESGEGATIEGWLLTPQGDGPFPMLLNVHGGPIVQFGDAFFHEVQTFVARGYAVLIANPRGSQGYGTEFAAAITEHWGERPLVDLMAAVDHVVANYPIDTDRMGVMGGSYGGYMTNWIVAHDHRFAAACTQRTVSNLQALSWGDFGSIWGHEIGALYWDDPDRYHRQSPIMFVRQMDTPMLILQGLGDLRTPADQGEQLYVALRQLGKEAEMVLFPGANHDLSRNGPVPQRIERLRVIHDWFDRRLAGSGA